MRFDEVAARVTDDIPVGSCLGKRLQVIGQQGLREIFVAELRQAGECEIRPRAAYMIWRALAGNAPLSDAFR